MSIVYFTGETEQLRELAECWQAEQDNSQFGFDLQADNVLLELDAWRKLPDAAIIVQKSEDKIVGLLCIFCMDSLFLGRKITIEKYWYVMPEYRKNGTDLLGEAKRWAKEKGCTHLTMAACHLSGARQERTCRFFDSLGMKLFEATYITEV